MRRRVPLRMYVENGNSVSRTQMENASILWKSIWKNRTIFFFKNVIFQWPFIRVLGVQEPASAAFSIFNFYAHYAMLKRFRKEVPNDSPLYWLWHCFCFVNLNAWTWSTIFHTRDIPLTELMDYACASSVVFTSCYCMIMR